MEEAILPIFPRGFYVSGTVLSLAAAKASTGAESLTSDMFL